MRECTKCLIKKENIDFPKIGNICKFCKNEYARSYRKDRDKTKDQRKSYYLNNKEKYKEWGSKNRQLVSKKYRETHVDKLSEYNKEYYDNNKDRISDWHKEYYVNNREHILRRNSEWRSNNIDKYNINRSRRHIDRIENDLIYRLSCIIRSCIISAFKRKFTNKSMKTIDIIGCSYSEFKIYLESRFDDHMNWDNYAEYWEIDHIVPLSWAETEDDVYKLNHYSNLQPLSIENNRAKSNLFAG